VKHPASDTIKPLSEARAGGRRGTPVGLFYVVEGVTTCGVALMLSSIYFYTTGRFGWGSSQNFLLATVLGVIYVLCALAAHAVSTRLGRRRTLVVSYAAMAALALCPLLAASPKMLVAALFFYSGISAITWPALESLVSAGAEPGKMARRLGVYNCVWSGAGALTMALAGLVLKYWEPGVFIVPVVVHAAMAALVWSIERRNTAPEAGPTTDPPPAAAEPELLRSRTLALWMSRLALPATFVVISSLLAAMPTLPLIQRLDPTARTAVGSVWMASRWLAFLALGATSWWHTRPRALLWAAVVLLAAFVAITFRGEWLPGAPRLATGPWVAWMAAWQVLLGLALGLIYSASLYFGMVLSDGSTEHGGYHEALIGLGTVIGPGAGALAERLGGGDPRWGVVAVGGVLAVSVVACAFVARFSSPPRVPR
jgi:MFS family permease